MSKEENEIEINEKPRRDGRKKSDSKKAAKIADKLDKKAALSDALGKQAGEMTKLLEFPDALTEHEIEILKSPHEIALYYREGFLERVKLGDRTGVCIDITKVKGADISHNHPGGLGPSALDLRILEYSPRSLRIIVKTDSGRRLYVITPLREIDRDELDSIADKYAEVSKSLGDTGDARLEALSLIKEDAQGMFDVVILEDI